jgi:hypothetical protein
LKGVLKLKQFLPHSFESLKMTTLPALRHCEQGFLACEQSFGVMGYVTFPLRGKQILMTVDVLVIRKG